MLGESIYITLHYIYITLHPALGDQIFIFYLVNYVAI